MCWRMASEMVALFFCSGPFFQIKSYVKVQCVKQIKVKLGYIYSTSVEIPNSIETLTEKIGGCHPP